MLLIRYRGCRVDVTTRPDLLNQLAVHLGLGFSPASKLSSRRRSGSKPLTTPEPRGGRPYGRGITKRPPTRGSISTGMNQCTGVITTPDRSTMFTNIQHPGENGGSTWPQNDGLNTPRSATMVVTKNDGGVIGS